MACSSMSYTPFTFYGLMFSMCLFCLFLRLFCYMLDSLKSTYNAKQKGLDAIMKKDHVMINYINRDAEIILKASIFDQVLYVLKTDDIHPPKSVISVHFFCLTCLMALQI